MRHLPYIALFLALGACIRFYTIAEDYERAYNEAWETNQRNYIMASQLKEENDRLKFELKTKKFTKSPLILPFPTKPNPRINL